MRMSLLGQRRNYVQAICISRGLETPLRCFRSMTTHERVLLFQVGQSQKRKDRPVRTPLASQALRVNAALARELHSASRAAAGAGARVRLLEEPLDWKSAGCECGRTWLEQPRCTP